MFTLLALTLFTIAVCAALVVGGMLAAKATVSLVLLPAKLILLPFLVAAVILKVGAIVAAVTVGLVLLIPVIVILGVIAVPFAFLAAVFG